MRQKRHLLNRPPAQSVTDKIIDYSAEVRNRLRDEAQSRKAKSLRQSIFGQVRQSYGKLYVPFTS